MGLTYGPGCRGRVLEGGTVMSDEQEPKEGQKPPAAPAEDPDKAELEALRREKAEREKAEREARDKELEELRAYKKAEEERKAKAVPAPKPKAEKAEEKPAEEKPPVKAIRPRSSVSRRWFGTRD